MSLLGRSIIVHVGKKSTMLISSGLIPRNVQTRPKSRITSYVLDKYVSFVKSWETSFKKNFPAAVKLINIYTVGMKDFKEDTIILFKAFKKVNAEGLSSLTRKELEIYYQMPKDILRTAPVLGIGAGVPFCGFMFVLAHFFPRLFLTHHFWSLQQNSEFSMINHKSKLQHYKPVFRCLQNQLSCLEKEPNYDSMKKILDSLGSGFHPSVDLILSCKSLFEKHPYGLLHITRSHTVGLLKLYKMHRGWRKLERLEHQALLLQTIDKAVVREGGFEALTQDEIKWHCFLRGLNPINMRKEDIMNWLNTWLAISEKVDERSYSLLLHCPVLLGYNQPSNWWLLHDKRK